jgi:glycosyltransferase involved in cell wall biosynthesis
MGGGAERVIMILLRHLDRSRFEPHLALLKKAGPYLGEIPADVPLHDLKASRVRYALPEIVRLVRELRPATVVTALSELNLAAAIIRPFFPRGVRLYLQEVTSLSAYLGEDGKDTRTMRWLHRRLYSRADKIICVSEYARRDLAEHFGIPRPKMTVIYNPVDRERVGRLADADENPFTTPGPHLVAVGRLVRVKGYDVLLDALARVRQTIPAQLTILGDGPLELDLKNQARRLGLADAVRFVGFQENPYSYFRHADLFVLSSRYEGLPLVVLEALSLGTPVVATDCPGGIREIIAEFGEEWLVPPSNAGALAEGIVSALQPGARKASFEDKLENTLEKFRLQRILKQYEDLL